MKLKKWLALLVMAALVVCLAACSQEASKNDKESTGEVTQAPSEPIPTESEDAAKMPSEPTPTESEEPSQTESEVVFWAEEGLEYPMSFFFSSGAGGWATELFLEADGSFSGVYHDSEMGSNGENYPNGTVYICHFTGRFGPAERLDMYTYGMKLEELSTERPVGEEWIEDGILYISSVPYGLEDGEDFIIYLPNTPAEMLSEDAYIWWPHRFEEGASILGGYGLYNLNGEYGFYCMTDA